MMPIHIVVIALLALVVAAPTFTIVFALTGKILNGVFKKVESIRHYFKYETKRARKKNKATSEITRKLSNPKKATFNLLQSRMTKDINIREISNFDIEQDKIFHGRVKVKTASKGVMDDHIYLFQPRVYSQSGTLLGPKFMDNGSLSDRHTYLARDGKTKELMTSYLPKREVLSGIQYDFVNTSTHANKDELADFIEVIIPQDEHGNYIPVDMNDPDERRKFDEYVEFFHKSNIDPTNYFLKRIKYAGEAYQAYLKENEIVPARPAKMIIDDSVNKVESSRPAGDLADNYSKYIYWKRFHGDSYNMTGLGINGNRRRPHMGARHHHGPRH